MIILGVDVGVTGALAALDERGEILALEDLPIARDRSAAWIDGADFLSMLMDIRQGRPARATVERLGAMPAQKGGRKFGGSHTGMSRGLTMGSVLAVLQVASLPVDLITPVQWKKALGLGPDKAESLERARLLFPTASLDRKKDHNRAEALLIAHWALREWRGDRKAA